MSTYNVLLEPQPDPVDAACIKLCAGLIVLSRDAVPQISRIAQNCLHSLVPPTDPAQPPPTPTPLPAASAVAAGPLAPGGPPSCGRGNLQGNLARALADAERGGAVGVGVRAMGATSTTPPLGPQQGGGVVTPHKVRPAFGPFGRSGGVPEVGEAEMAAVREGSECSGSRTHCNDM